MAKPIKRGPSWEGTINFRGERYRRLFPTEPDAEAWTLEGKARLLRGEPVDMGDNVKRTDGRPYTLQELVDHVYKTHWAPMAGGQKALINARSIIAMIGPQKAIARVSKVDIDKARADLLATGNSPATVNRKLASLSKCFSEAEDMGIIDTKPKFKRFKESEHRVRRFTAEEERLTLQFFERISQQDMLDYVVLSLDTGMRQGEVLGLHHEDAHDGRVTVWGIGSNGQRTKSGKSRSVKLTKRAQDVLDRRRKETNGREVFPDLNSNQVGHYWGRLSEALSLDEDRQFVPHILRHEFCSRLAAKGVNAAVIQQLAGHSTMAITQRYVHLFGTDLDSAIDGMQEAPEDRLAELRAMLAVLTPEERKALLEPTGR